MATFTITAPDGKRYKVTGATKEGALAALKSKLEGPQQPTQPPPKEVNPAGTGVSRAIQRGVLQTAAAVPTMAATADIRALSDQDRLASAEEKRGIIYDELKRAGVPTQAFASRGVNLDDPQNVVALMQQYSVPPAAQANFSQVVEKRLDNASQVDTAAATQRAQSNLEAAGALQDKAAALPKSSTASRYEQSLAEAPDSFKGWLGSITNDPVGFMAWAGETLSESGPSIAGGLATTAVAGPVAGSSVLALGGLSREYSNEVNRFLEEKGVDLSDPNSAKVLLNNPQAMGEANQRGLTRGLVIAMFELAGQGAVASNLFGKTLARRTVSQATTEGGGEAAATASVGDDVSIKEALAEGAVGAGATIPEAAIAGKNKLFTSDGELDVNNLNNSTKLAAGDVARELQQIARAEGFKLSNVDVTAQFGAKGALEAVREQNNGEITELVKALKGKLNSKNASSLDQVISDFAPANAGIKSGKNKVSGYVSKTQMAALARLVGPYQEGAALMNALAKSNVITGLFKGGMKGGVSQFTDYFSPFGTSGAVYDPTRIGNIIVGGGAAAATLGQSVPIQAGIVGLGRLVDAATGRRNKLSRFVNKNVNAQGLPSPSGLSLVDKAKTAEADAKVRREALASIATQIDAPPNANSPVGTILSGTGLSRDGLSQTINSMAQDFAGQPELAPVLESIQQNMDGDTNPVLELNEIIPIIGQYAQMTAPELIVATPDNPLLARGVQQSPTQTDVQTEAPSQPLSGNQFTTPENYQAGKIDNNSFARTLASQVSEDAGVSVSDKAQLMTALEDVQSSLGPDPVAALDEITTELQNIGVNQDTIDTYFKPYRDRVALQQARVGRMQAPETEDRPRFAKDLNSASQEPTLQTYVNPLNVPQSEINATRLNESPSEADIQKMREGSYKPTKKRNLVEAADYMHQKWKEATGRSEPFEYTPENVDIISTYMATEAANALQSDANAIGWYDRKLKAAKRVVSLVDPRVTQSPDAEAAFDFALAVTSNGQAVADNFQYALEVFRHFMDNGKMPTDTWIKGGERNAAMLEAFDFFNAYQSSGANMPIQDFMDQDFTVNELNDYISRFNAQYGTEIKVPSSEGANAQVKGSYIIGPKIGQGFYQNIRGNYDPLTMDIWWMRMWNRLVGRPFVADPDLDQGRSNVKGALKTAGKLEQKMINQTLKEMGVGKRDINKDPALFDDFVTKVEKRYQKFYKKYKEENGVNHTKPNFFKKTGTHVKNLKPQLQAQPKGPSERAYMRDVTKAAIAKLSDLGYNIETADFQALMWYPEKQLFRHLGVAPGRGSDNDYLDAAIMLAEGEGIANDQIQEALPDADGDGAVNNQPSTPRGDEGLYRGDGSDGPSQESPRFNQQPTGVAGILAQRIQGSQDGSTARRPVPTTQEVKLEAPTVRAAIEIGKPGGAFENGIPQGLENAKRFAKAVDITLQLVEDNEAMLDAARITGEDRDAGKNASGVYNKYGAFVMKPGSKLPSSDRFISDFEAYVTAFHETMHGLSGTDLDGRDVPEALISKNYLTGEVDYAAPKTFDGLIGQLVNTPSVSSNKVIKDILKIQDEEVFTNGDNVQPVRISGPAKRILGVIPDMAERAEVQAEIDRFERYSRSVSELAVDALTFYGMEPKRMKKEYPHAAKAVREFFKNSTKVQFYSHPLAMAFAVVMAMLMKQEQAEEEERQKQQQMAPGALTPPPGALTAA
jgi:hypothetical protein